MQLTSASAILALLAISPSILSVIAAPTFATTDPHDIDYSNPPVEAKKRAAESIAVAKFGETKPVGCTGDLLGKTLPECGHTYRTRNQVANQAPPLDEMTKRSPAVGLASPPINSLKSNELANAAPG